MRRLMWPAIVLILATALAALSVSALAATSLDGASSCPAAAPQALRSDLPGSGLALVPGTPNSALICSYNGFSEPGQHLAGFMLLGQRALRRDSAASLGAQFDRLPKWPPYGTFSCPADAGREAVVYFRYASGFVDPVTVSLQGCAGSSNGQARREGFPPTVGTVHGSAAFIRAHQGWVAGTAQICGGPYPGLCRPLKGGVRVLAGGREWNGTASIHNGVFAQRATPGRDLVEYAQGWLSGNPKPVLKRWVTVRGGHTTRVNLQLIVP